MPVIVSSEDKTVERQGQGWKVQRVAGQNLFNGEGLAAFHWILDPQTSGPEMVHGNYDEMIYVISGSGTAFVGGRRLPLETEDLLWLEPGDRCYFEAGAQGLELLQGYAPED